MKFFDKSAVMAIATGAIVFSACSHETDYYNPDLNPNKAQYEKNWKNTFGDINPEQDWNVAAKVTASVSLDGMQDAANIMVYTGLPGGLNSRLVAAYPAQTRTFSFDYEESAKDAYVLITDRNDRILLGNYFSIDNGEINIALNTRGTRAEDGCGTSLGETIKTNNVFRDEKGYWPADLYESLYNPAIKYNDVFDLYKLNNVATKTGSSWKISDIVDIVGKGGVFAEQQYNEKGECNLIKWEEDLKPSEGAEYVMEEDGPMEITFMYGGTIKFNKLGYICYKDGATKDEILKSPRYLLMDDARPQHNVTIDGTSMGEQDGMKLPGLVESYEKYDGADATLTGTTYKLAYFDENGNSSFTFPAGTHIVFFEIIGNNGSWWNEDQYCFNIRYSLPWMNRDFYYKRNENHPSWKEYDAAQTFVTYRWNGQTVLGMEDEGGDDDMNDILFFVNGKFKSHDIPDIGNDPAPQEWILACEDLGSTDDFDFNDVVFRVSHIAGKTEAEVTVLDAGGILPATIFRGDTEIGEAHEMLGVATNVMTTDEKNTTVSEPKKISVPADFSMTENMGGFKIYVANNETSVVSVNAPGKGEVPQIICVPGTWKWPKERVSISDAYPDFGTWGANWQDNTWYNNISDEKNVISK